MSCCIESPRVPAAPVLTLHASSSQVMVEGKVTAVKAMMRGDVTSHILDTTWGPGARAAGVASDLNYQAFLEWSFRRSRTRWSSE